MTEILTAKIIKTLSELRNAGLIDSADEKDLEAVTKQYSFSLPPNIVKIIRNAKDKSALLKQFIPDSRELITRPEELNDPIGDEVRSPIKGLVHRYRNRVLIKPVEVCPVYCRFCFRRENVGDNKGHSLKSSDMPPIYEYLRNHNEVQEVILTGGDPLILSHRRVREIAQNIAKIPHILFFRIHTRAIIGEPELVNDDFIASLKTSQKAVKIVLHINHAEEINHEVKIAINKLITAGIPIYSQSVLLKGVNDNPQKLADLFNTLLVNNITPYYLHHPDLAKGTGHFYLNFDEGRKIYRETAKLVSGLALPKYVIDIPGGYGKIEVISHQIIKTDDCYIIIDNNGIRHQYPIL